MEVRPCFGRVWAGDLLVPSENKKIDEQGRSWATFRAATPNEDPMAIALTNAHSLGFVAMARFRRDDEGDI